MPSPTDLLVGLEATKYSGLPPLKLGDRGRRLDRCLHVGPRPQHLGRLNRAFLEQSLFGVVVQHPAGDRQRREHQQGGAQDRDWQPASARRTTRRCQAGGFATWHRRHCTPGVDSWPSAWNAGGMTEDAQPIRQLGDASDVPAADPIDESVGPTDTGPADEAPQGSRLKRSVDSVKTRAGSGDGRPRTAPCVRARHRHRLSWRRARRPHRRRDPRRCRRLPVLPVRGSLRVRRRVRLRHRSRRRRHRSDRSRPQERHRRSRRFGH